MLPNTNNTLKQVVIVYENIYSNAVDTVHYIFPTDNILVEFGIFPQRTDNNFVEVTRRISNSMSKTLLLERTISISITEFFNLVNKLNVDKIELPNRRDTPARIYEILCIEKIRKALIQSDHKIASAANLVDEYLHNQEIIRKCIKEQNLN